jgi:hypothetical protein
VFDWRCPACAIEIDDAAAQQAPRPGQIYRCYGCLLELVMDAAANRLAVASYASADRPSSSEPRRI